MEPDSIRETTLAGFDQIEIGGRGSLALVSGDVPRLVVREGSHAWDLWEGQCLPIRAARATLINPFSRPARVTLGRGMPLQIRPPEVMPTNRHLERVRTIVTPSDTVGVAGRRLGTMLLAKRGSFSIESIPAAATASRVQLINGVPPNFMAYAAAGVLAGTSLATDCYGRTPDNLSIRSGTITDAELTAWMTAYAIPAWALVTLTTDQTSDDAQRWITSPNVAVLLSGGPGLAYVARYALLERGCDPAEWN